MINNELLDDVVITNNTDKLSILAQVFSKNIGKNKTFREMNLEVKEKLQKIN